MKPESRFMRMGITGPGRACTENPARIPDGNPVAQV